MVVYAFNPTTQDGKADAFLRVGGQLGLLREYQARQGYVARYCKQTTNQKNFYM